MSSSPVASIKLQEKSINELNATSITSSTNEPKHSAWTNFKDSFKPPESNRSRPQPQLTSSSNSEDADSTNKTGDNNNNNDDIEEGSIHAPLKQTLKKRQLQMIALGGCVGSGLLVASGLAMENGPASLIVAWSIVSTFLYCTMQSLAELSSSYPVTGSFATYSVKFVDPSWGFAMGWNYAMFWVIVLPLELVASALTINFWNSDINSDAWVAIFYVLIFFLNMCGNKGFGETEFVASIIKLLGIVGFNILAIVLICGGGDQGFIGGKNWHPPFTTGFKGVVSVLLTATYSLAGTELIGLTSSESAGDSRKILPKAIKQVVWRILIFYMTTLTLLGCLVNPENPDLVGASGNAASPFVIAIKQGGIKGLPSVFNVVILVALLAIANSAVYGFSRTILALAEQGLAPKFYTYVDRKGRPLAGIGTSAFIGLLSFVSASKSQADVFAWLVALSGLSTLFTWGSINGAFIRYRMAMKEQGRSTDDLAYKSNTGLIGAYYGLIANVAILGLQFWLALFPVGESPKAVTFFKTYLGGVIVIVFYIGHKLWTRSLRFYIKAKDIDLDNGKSAVDIDLIKQEIQEEKEALRAKPLYYRVYEFWC